MSTAAINIRLSDALMDELQRYTDREERGRRLVAAIDEEIGKFQDWSLAKLGGPLAKFEIAAIRTYLYRTITGELDGDEWDIMNLPTVVVSSEATV